jgi:hypothetical protein
MCQQHDEKIDHKISACPILAKEEYVKRHDRAHAQLHFTCKETGVKLDKELVPELVETSHESKVTILWNQQLKTDRTAP